MLELLIRLSIMFYNMEKNFLFAANDGYAKFVGVTIKSILNTNPIGGGKCVFHILTDGISRSNQEWLNRICTGYNADVKVYIVDEDNDLKSLESYRGNRYTWYRILFCKYLDLEEIKKNGNGVLLYLDVDILVDGCLDELFRMDMKGKSIAACPDTACNPTRCEKWNVKNYIGAGVILFNVAYWQKHHLSEKCIEWGCQELNDEDNDMPDQDTINVICNDTKVLLPVKYNFLIWFQKHYGDLFNKYNPGFEKSVQEAIQHPVIIHYATANPWHHFASDILRGHTWKWVALWYKTALSIDFCQFIRYLIPSFRNSIMNMINR